MYVQCVMEMVRSIGNQILFTSSILNPNINRVFVCVCYV